MKRFDIAIVGAGIAGASLAAEVATHASTIIIEGEDQPGYHATGRSAAFWSETYGGPGIQPLTTASGPALTAGGFLQPMGAVRIGTPADRHLLDALLADFEGSSVRLDVVDPRGLIPGLRDQWTLAVREPTCAYIDVGGLHGAFLARARGAGAVLALRAPVRGAARVDGCWQIACGTETIAADVIVNAAGAWADDVAALAGAQRLGIQPNRRTLVQLRTDPGTPADLPHVAALNGSFYFKPEPGGRLWLSPHDETPVAACDVAPEEIDVAIAIDRLETVVDWRVMAVERKWAGLRSFARDRLPVYGFDARAPGFFWCAGQGGFGIQTSPAAAKLAAAIVLGRAPDASVAHIDAARYAADRFSD